MWQGILVKQVLERDRFICQICLKSFQKEELEVHHVIPKRLRGIDTLNNLTTVCKICHKLIELQWYRGLISFNQSVLIRISEETKQRLSERGKHGESFDDIIRRLIWGENKDG